MNANTALSFVTHIAAGHLTATSVNLQGGKCMLYVGGKT